MKDARVRRNSYLRIYAQHVLSGNQSRKGTIVNAERTVFVSLDTKGNLRRSKLSDILQRLDEDPSEYENTPKILAVAETLVEAGVAKGIVILFDGSPILSAGESDLIPTSAYN